jgi:hypothetical protein
MERKEEKEEKEFKQDVNAGQPQQPEKPSSVSKNGIVFLPPSSNRNAKVFSLFFYLAESSPKGKMALCLKCKKILKGINASNCKSHIETHNTSLFPDVQQYLGSIAAKQEEVNQAEENALQVYTAIHFFFSLTFISADSLFSLASLFDICSLFRNFDNLTSVGHLLPKAMQEQVTAGVILQNRCLIKNLC